MGADFKPVGYGDGYGYGDGTVSHNPRRVRTALRKRLGETK